METRKILLTIAAVLLFVTTRSQPIEPEKLSFGFLMYYEGMFRPGKVNTNSSPPENYPYSSQGAYSFGANIEYQFDEIFGVRTGFMMRNLDYTYGVGISILDTSTNTSELSYASYHHHTVYGEVPLSLTLYKHVKSSSFGVGLTISYLFLIEQDQSGSLRYADDNTLHPLNDEYAELEIETDERKSSFSLHINYTYRIQKNFKMMAEPSLRLMQGTDVMPLTGETTNIAFFGLKIGIYYML